MCPPRKPWIEYTGDDLVDCFIYIIQRYPEIVKPVIDLDAQSVEAN